MEGKIHFSGSAPGPTDPLCTELTAYIKVNEELFLREHLGHLSCLFISK